MAVRLRRFLPLAVTGGVQAAVGAAAGTGAASGVGASTAAAVGAAAGVGAASGVGRSTAAAVGAAAGTGSVAAVSGNAWDSANKTASLTLSNANRTALSGGADQQVRSLAGHATGKWVFRVTADSHNVRVFRRRACR
jgi:hypothetical protein